MPPTTPETLRSRNFGFAALLTWASLGFALEAAHALKLSAYLDHPLRRELLVWAHAHGVGLALIVLAYAALAAHEERAAAHGARLRAAALILPLGFALAIFGHGEADPGPAIWLVPAGALLLLWALAGITRALRA